MELLPSWAPWLFVGVLLLVFEVFTGTFFLACFGIGAIGAAFSASVSAPVEVSWLVFVGLSAFAVFLARRFANNVTKRSDRKATVDRLLGEIARVSETIDPISGTGHVVVRGETWRATSDDRQIIPVDSEVLVKSVQGNTLTVSKHR